MNARYSAITTVTLADIRNNLKAVMRTAIDDGSIRMNEKGERIFRLNIIGGIQWIYEITQEYLEKFSLCLRRMLPPV